MLRHQAWLEIDLTALVSNARVLRRAIPTDAQLGLMVKANGYGHGLEMAARAGVAGGADRLMVASLDEGLELRRAGITSAILVVYPIPPEGVGDAVAAGLELSICCTGSTRRTLEAWAGDGASSGPMRLHVEVDTGMGRGGVAPDALVDVIGRIHAVPGTSLDGIWSHLADGSDPVRSAEQVERYEAALAAVAATGRPVPMRHVAATDGVFAGTSPAYDMVRVGLGFYGELGLGYEPALDRAALAGALRPAMTVRARPVRLETMPIGASVGYGGEWVAERPSLIATLPIGYADGWTRAYWPGARALVRGQSVPLVGRVSMDAVCVDATDAADTGEVTLDEVFVLLGGDGSERISPNELARLRGSIPNEVFCAFGPRLPRVYLDDGNVAAVSHQAARMDRVPGTSW